MNETLWDTVPDAPTLPLTDREMLFVWGKERGFPYFSFDINGTCGAIHQGKENWERMLDVPGWKNESLSFEKWLKYAMKAISEASNP